MTGRNLQEEAGPGKGVGGGCKTPKESSDKGPGVPFIPELESLFWDLAKQNQPTTKTNNNNKKKTKTKTGGSKRASWKKSGGKRVRPLR